MSTIVKAVGGKKRRHAPMTADGSEDTADTTNITADGATLDLATMKKVYSVDVQWPATTAMLNFNAATGAQDQNFVLRAITVVDMGWKQICSATATVLEVYKFP